MKRICLLCSVLALTLAGCARDVSPDSYGIGSVGNVNRAVRGEIISARKVKINGTSGTGSAAGGVAGGAAGWSLGGNSEGHVVGAVGGAVAGAAIGAAIEKSATKQTGMEYVVQTGNGALMTIVQGDEHPFSEGQKVIVLYGTRSRIIADKSAK